MRKLRQLSMAIVLTLMLGTCALAGITETPPGTIGTGPGTIECPPATESSASSTGIVDTPPSAQPLAASSDPFVEVALSLMQSLLSAF